MKIGFLGLGNMAQMAISSLISANVLKASEIFGTNRSKSKLEKVKKKLGITTFDSNEELFDACDIVVICVKPQQFQEAIEPLKGAVSESHIIVSFAAGISLEQLRKYMPIGHLVRMMPNTPIKVNCGVIAYAYEETGVTHDRVLQYYFSCLGDLIYVPEDEMFEAFTVAAASGPGFLFELMIYWQEWLADHGFTEEVARQIVVKTFLGTAKLASIDTIHSLEELQAQVVSKNGVTSSGLDSIRKLEIERALRVSFEKAVLRDKELQKILI